MPYKDKEKALEMWRLRARRRGWTERDKAWSAAKHANLRAVRWGVPGQITQDEALAILAVGRCYYCGVDGQMTLDHVVPMKYGGVNATWNIVAACGSCNKRKRNRTPSEWSMGVVKT